MTDYCPTPEQQAADEIKKADCYRRWRADKLAQAKAWLAKLKGKAYSEAWQKIEKKYGKRFTADLRKYMRGELKV